MAEDEGETGEHGGEGHHCQHCDDIAALKESQETLAEGLDAVSHGDDTEGSTAAIEAIALLDEVDE